MRLSLIVAIGSTGQIGKDNQLLWHLKSDLQNFKKITSGHTILMGRKTFESIGKPLPRRRNIVVSTQHDYCPDGVEVIHGIDEAIELAQKENESELFIIGGAQIYKALIHKADRIYLTEVDYDGEADAYFPSFNRKDFDLSDERILEEGARFMIFDRRRA